MHAVLEWHHHQWDGNQDWTKYLDSYIHLLHINAETIKKNIKWIFITIFIEILTLTKGQNIFRRTLDSRGWRQKSIPAEFEFKTLGKRHIWEVIHSGILPLFVSSLNTIIDKTSIFKIWVLLYIQNVCSCQLCTLTN